MTQGKGTPARIPCLDGIRAISIGLVLISHLIGTRNFELTGTVAQMGNTGTLGVRVFFVISGYLITTLLLAEHARHGAISISQFYMRRTFRIFPAFYAFVLVVLVASALGWVTLRDRDTLHAVTYTMNYHHDRAWVFGHLWSLAVEEQFYLLWPAIFLFLGLRGARWVAAAYILIAPAVRVLTWHYLPEQRVGIGESFQTVADAIATGCVLAFVRPSLDRSARFLRAQSRSITLVALLVVIFVIDYHRGSIRMSYPVGETVMNVSIALVLDWCLRNPGGRVGALLNARPMVHIGLLSYSLYLWQQPFLDRTHHALATSFPLNLALTYLAALASYHLVETPCLRWRTRISKRWPQRRKPGEPPASTGEHRRTV